MYMADTTIVNTPATQDSGTAGLVLVVVILVAIIGGGFLWYRYHGGRMMGSPTSTNINVTLPSTGGTNSTGSGTGY